MYGKVKFEDEILGRFKKHDALRRRIWIVTMNRRNIKCILKRCIDANIHILPLSEHITPSDYTNEQILQKTMEDFIRDFSKLLDKIIGEEIMTVSWIGSILNVCIDVINRMKERIWILKKELKKE